MELGLGVEFSPLLETPVTEMQNVNKIDIPILEFMSKCNVE